MLKRLLPLLLLLALPAQAGTIALGWDAVPTATSYKLCYGTTPGSYPTCDTATATTWTFGSMTDCTPYYIAVKACNASGCSAGWSNEVSGLPRIWANAIPQTSAAPGTTWQQTLTGGNFKASVTAKLVGVTPDIPCTLTVGGCNGASVSCVIPITAATGPRTLQLTGESGTSVAGLSIATVMIGNVTGLVRKDVTP